MSNEKKDLKIVNVEVACLEQVHVNALVNVAKWHPRHPGKILIGSELGEIKMFDIEKKAFEIEYSAFRKIDTMIKD